MMPGGEVEMIIGKGSVVYVRAPMLARFIPAKTPWIKLDPSALPQQPGGVGAAAAAINPAAILAAIKDAISVDEVGPDTVDGADATHYRATRRPGEAAAVDRRAHTRQADRRRDAGGGGSAARSSVWRRCRSTSGWTGTATSSRSEFALDLSTIAPDRPGASFSITLTLSDIGEDISIDVPPASQVTDLTDLLGSAFTPASVARLAAGCATRR